MRLAMRSSLWSLASLCILTACTGYAPPANVTGLSTDQLVAQMGQPDMRRQLDGGTRLEFPRGPYGKHTWFVYLDATGHVTRSEQVLTEKNFNQISPGMDQDEVRNRLGRPGEVQELGRARGTVWSYRYERFPCQWFQMEISKEGKVRSAGYGQPPECEGKDVVRFPS